ncbi:unnamed protein product, partial [Staurois parvus]
MIGTSHRGPVQIGVPLCPVNTVGTGLQCCALLGSTHSLKMRALFMNSNPLLHCSHPTGYVHGPDRKWL